MTHAGATVIPFPVRHTRKGTQRPVDALIELVRRHAIWRRNHPHATVEQDLAAGERIAQELGL